MPPLPSLRFARYRDIATLAAERLAASRDAAADPLRPWPEEVLVSSGGLGAAIARELIARVPAGVAGVQIQTLETLAKRILNDAGEYPRVASEAERRLAMRTAIRAVEHPMMETRGVASMLERAYRDVRDGGLSLVEVRERASRVRGLRNPERTRAIFRAWAEYERLIVQLGAIDPADLFTRAAKVVSRVRVAPQLLAGFYDMTGVQLALVEALRDAGRLAAVFIPAGDGEAYRFALPFVRRFTEAEVVSDPLLSVRRTAVTALQHDTKESEVRETCHAIAALIAKGVAPDAIGVVARSLDAYDARLFARFAEGFPIACEEETPLLATRVGRGVANLLRLRERNFPRGEVLELIRDGFRAKTRINVDKADVETRRARIAGGASEALKRIKRRTPPVDDYIALVEELETLTAPLAQPLRGDEWNAFLRKLPFKVESQRDVAAAEELDKVAELFARAARWSTKFDVPSVIDAMEQRAIERRQASGVWLGDVMQFRGRAFEHVFAIRLQDDVFPQRRVEDPLLPDADRRLLGIREIGNGREEEQLLFRLMEDGASSLTYSYAGTDGFGKVLRASRFIRAMTAAHPPTTDNRQPTTDLRVLQLLARTGTRSTFDGYVPTARVEAALQSITPTKLEDFGECPQKFLFKHVLGVTDLDDPEHELQINHRVKGSVDHRILEQFYRSLPEEEIAAAAGELPRLPAPIAQRLESIVDTEFDRLDEEAPPFNRTMRQIERRATKRVLRDFVAADLADLLANDLRPRHFEYRFGGKWRERADHPEPFVVTAHGIPIRIEGSVDRIDAGGDRFRIVDYKSGKALRHINLGDKIDRGVRLQLALYAMAVSEFFRLEPNAVSGTIKPLVVSGDAKQSKFAFSLAEKRPVLTETLDVFVGAITRGAFPAFPNERDDEFNSCKYCPVSHSCRTKHDAEERYGVAQLRDPKTLLRELF